MYREVRMVEITEVLRLWRAGVPKKRIAARLGLDPQTVRRYVSVAEGTGLRVGGDPISEMQLRDVLLALHPGGGRPRGDDWDRCRAESRLLTSVNRGEWTSVVRFPAVKARYARIARATVGRLRKV